MGLLGNIVPMEVCQLCLGPCLCLMVGVCSPLPIQLGLSLHADGVWTTQGRHMTGARPLQPLMP